MAIIKNELVPFDLGTVRQIEFYSVFNMKRDKRYSFGSFNEGARTQIFENYIDLYEKEMSRKTGNPSKNAGRDYIEASGLLSIFTEDVVEQLRAMTKARDQFTINTSNLNAIGKKIWSGKREDVLSDKEIDEVLKEYKILEKSLQAYLNSFSEIPNHFGKGKPGEVVAKAVSGTSVVGTPSKVFQLDKKASTSLENTIRTLEELSRTIDKMEAKKVSGKIVTRQDTNIVRPAKKLKSTGVVSKEVQYSADKVLSKINGALVNVAGFALEGAIANGLQKSIDQNKNTFKEVFLSGAAGAGSIEVEGLSENFTYGERKVDVGFKDEHGVTIGLSAKNQREGQAGKKVSLNSSSLEKILLLVSGSQADSASFQKAYMYNSRRRNSVQPPLMRMFLAALTADYAVAMGGSDRVDFVVFQDSIVPLNEYYKHLEKTFKLSLSSEKSYTIRELMKASQNQILSHRYRATFKG